MTYENAGHANSPRKNEPSLDPGLPSYKKAAQLSRLGDTPLPWKPTVGFFALKAPVVRHRGDGLNQRNLDAPGAAEHHSPPRLAKTNRPSRMVCPDPWRRHRSDWHHSRLGRLPANRRRRILVLSFRWACIDCRRVSSRATQVARRLDLCRRLCGHHDLGFLGSRPKRLAAGAARGRTARPLATRHLILACTGRGTRTSAKAMGT